MMQTAPAGFDRADKELWAGAFTAPVFLQGKIWRLKLSLCCGCDLHRQACGEMQERSG